MRWRWGVCNIFTVLITKRRSNTPPIIISSLIVFRHSRVQFYLKESIVILVKSFQKDPKHDYKGQTLSVRLPLLCSHPSLTITTLVMLEGRVEDPGFPQGETQLRFPTFLYSALCRSLETGSWVLLLPSQWWLPISWKRVKISLILRGKSFLPTSSEY